MTIPIKSDIQLNDSFSIYILQEKLSPLPTDFLYDASMEINDWIKASRTRAGMTQDQLAESLGVTRGNVSAWENGRHEPNISQLKRIAILCSTDPTVLFGAPEQKNVANWPFSVEYSLFAAMPSDERQRINDFIVYSVGKWHADLPAKSKKAS